MFKYIYIYADTPVFEICIKIKRRCSLWSCGSPFYTVTFNQASHW